MMDLELKAYSCVVKSDDTVSTYVVLAKDTYQVLELLDLGKTEELQSITRIAGLVILPLEKHEQRQNTKE